MQVELKSNPLVTEAFPAHLVPKVTPQQSVQAQLGPIHRGEVAELSRATFRVLRGSTGKKAAHAGTQVRTVLSPGMLGSFERQVLARGLTRTGESTTRNTCDYLVLDGHLDVDVDGQRYHLAAGDRLVVPRGLPQQVVDGDAGNKVLVSFIDANTSPRPIHLPLLQQPEINSEFCGHLRNVLFQGMVEGTDQVMAEDLTDSVGHVHHQFTEDYLVTRGSVRLALFDSKTRSIEVVELQEGDRVIMPPGTGHKVIGGSKDNQILVTCTPGFRANDETRCEELESFGRRGS